MSDETRLRIAGDDVVHQALFSGEHVGQTRCRVSFAWKPNVVVRADVALATKTHDDCDCMTCLATVDALGEFVIYQAPGIGIVNTEAIKKLGFP